MPVNLSPQRHTVARGEIVNVAVSMIGLLDAGELLTGTPTVLEVTTTDLTLGSKIVNTASITINSVVNLAGQAVTFTAAPTVTALGSYTVTVTCGTNATPAQTRKANVKITVVAT